MSLFHEFWASLEKLIHLNHMRKRSTFQWQQTLNLQQLIYGNIFRPFFAKIFPREAYVLTYSIEADLVNDFY